MHCLQHNNFLADKLEVKGCQNGSNSLRILIDWLYVLLPGNELELVCIVHANDHPSRQSGPKQKHVNVEFFEALGYHEAEAGDGEHNQGYREYPLSTHDV